MNASAGRSRRAPARLAGLLVALTLVLVGASQAMATVRYAVPGGDTSDPNCFAKSSNAAWYWSSVRPCRACHAGPPRRCHTALKRDEVPSL